MFVEFANPISVNRALKIASQNKAIVYRKPVMIYKAGTGTFVYCKKRKGKDFGRSKTAVFEIMDYKNAVKIKKNNNTRDLSNYSRGSSLDSSNYS